ncbi:MAG: GNAT family N-acetyltransferase [Alphaproteobacteria bacterium]|nr:GNAT family N-acetyltransferase [Alphaproteobacteria bacterium]
MNEIEFVALSEIDEAAIIELMNNDEVGKLLPLLQGGFSAADCKAFVNAKTQLWEEHGFGPWAFVIKGEFAGWGGIQPEQGEADFALVLHPDFWGWGRKIFNKVRDQAFNEMNRRSMTILFPPTRTNSRAIMRYGFVADGQMEVDGEIFLKFRLNKP